jgi:hypothetical protein
VKRVDPKVKRVDPKVKRVDPKPQPMISEDGRLFISFNSITSFGIKPVEK